MSLLLVEKQGDSISLAVRARYKSGETTVSYLRNGSGRRIAAKGRKVVNDVHLVVIAEGVGDIEPGSLWRRNFGIECRLKTLDTGKHLGRRPHFPAEISLELAQPGRRPTYNPGNPHTAALSKM